MMLPAVICVLACALSFLLGCWGAVTWCRRINKCILGQRDDVDRWQREMDAGVSREMQRRLKMRISSKKALKDTGENLAIKDGQTICGKTKRRTGLPPALKDGVSAPKT